MVLKCVQRPIFEDAKIVGEFDELSARTGGILGLSVFNWFQAESMLSA